MESPTGEDSVRLPDSHAVIYPCTLHHRVEPVTAGKRNFAADWIRSRMRHADQRELLLELDTGKHVVLELAGKDEIFGLTRRSYSNFFGH